MNERVSQSAGRAASGPGREKRYRAFISYSQADKEPARRLHRALERYRLPRGLSGAASDAPGRRLGRFFRDDEEMGAASDLGEALRGAIADSEALIVICSPHAARSRWVNEEILHFKGTGRAASIYAVIVAGTPDASEPESECFPPALRFAVDETGALTDVPAAPLGLDLRQEPFSRVQARLVAGLLGIPFDDLWRRHRRRTRRRAALAALGVLALGAAGSWAALNTIRSALEAAQGEAALLAEAAIDIMSAGDAPEDAILMALHAAAADQRGRSKAFFVRSEASAPVRAALAATVTHRRIERVLVGHDDAVVSVAFSPDEEYAVTGSRDGTARIWDLETGAERTVLAGHGGAVLSVAVSPDATQLVTGSEDGFARTWVVATGAPSLAFRVHEGGVASVAYSPDGSHILTSGEDRTARLWQSSSGESVGVLTGAEGVLPPAIFTPDGGGILTVVPNGAMLWDAETLEPVRPVAFHGGPQGVLTSLSVSRDGEAVLTSAMDGFAVLWNLADGAAIDTISDDTGQPIAAAGLFTTIPGGYYVLTAPESGLASLWYAWPNRRLIATYSPDHAIEAVTIGPTGRRALIAERGGEAVVWRTQLGDPVRKTGTGAVSAAGAPVLNYAVSPDGKRAIAGSVDSTAVVWDLDSRERIATLRGHTGFVEAVAFSPSGDSAMTGSHDGTAILWNVRTGAALLRLSGHETWVRSVAFSSDGRFVLTTGQDLTAKLWDLQGARVVAAFDNVSDFGKFLPDGRSILTGIPWDSVMVWEIPPIVLASPREQIRIACEILRKMNAPVAFTENDVQRYPILADEPRDAHDPALLESPCVSAGAGS